MRCDKKLSSQRTQQVDFGQVQESLTLGFLASYKQKGGGEELGRALGRCI